MTMCLKKREKDNILISMMRKIYFKIINPNNKYQVQNKFNLKVQDLKMKKIKDKNI